MKKSYTFTVTDSLGRKIEVRRPSKCPRHEARKAMSAESQEKPMLMGEAMLAFLIVSIDGSVVMPPTSEIEVEALLDRLGDEGIMAAGGAMLDSNGEFWLRTLDAKHGH